jgi:two-component system nitrogen regulation response regulator NtrX
MPNKDGERTRVLVVDDDGEVRGALEMLLAYEGFEVWTARDGREALARLEREAAAGGGADVVLCDVKMPGLDGPGVLDALARRGSSPPVIMISGHADVATAVDAVKRGARDFIEKPLDHNRVLVSIQAALRAERLAQENSGLRRQLDQRWQLVGESAPMLALREHIARAARSDAPVLITGENGTGKELVARQIHLGSARASGPLVTVNCAAIPAELIESELFGHEKGSFTGAHERRTGHFEAAEGGTLFLDEIGDMPLAAQSKVLRALETFEITRVGSTQSRRVDLRVVAATNADLAAAVEEKSFRLDLFYRLNVVPLRVPPLRERPGDIPALCEHFLRRLAERGGRAPFALEPEALGLLTALDWPGNVRQLRNLLEGACVLADGTSIGRADLERILENGPALSQAEAAAVGAAGGAAADPFQAATFEEFKDRSEALFFSRKLAERGGNIKRTAEELGMQRSHLYKKLDRYGLR